MTKGAIQFGESTIRQTCRICGSHNLRLLIDYGFVPLAGGFLPPDAVDQNFVYPLRLARCEQCTLMQVLDTIPPDDIFRQYSYTSSTTRTLSQHFQNMGRDLLNRWNGVGKLVVEIGCNDGVLLRPLRDAGAQVIGVDPSDVAYRASIEQDWPLVNDYFTVSIAAQIRDKYGLARIVTANNTFAHMDDLHTVVMGVNTLLEPDGVFVFEVHYQGELIRLVQFDTVYHEHICYYSLTSIDTLMRMHDLRIIDVEPIPIHSGSIRVTVAHASSDYSPAPSLEAMFAEESRWNIDSFILRVMQRKETIQRLVTHLHDAKLSIGAYGAAGRCTILLNFCQLGPNVIDYVVDMSPLRYGKMIPGVWTPILPPEYFYQYPPQYMLLTAWNYEAEVIKKEQSYLLSGGHFIIPLPEVRIAGAI